MQLKKLCVATVTGLVALAPLAVFAGSGNPPAKPSAMSLKEAQQRMKSRSARFIENAGQWDQRALYRGHSNGLSVWVTRDGLVYDYSVKSGKGFKGQAVHMTFDGGRTARAQGIDKQSITTQFMSHSHAKPITVKSYGETLSKNIYPGIDVRNYFSTGRPRYDFLVAPNADASRIRMKFVGANQVAVKDNEIVLGTQLGDLKNGSLKAYQIVNGHEKTVAANFKLEGKNTVGLALGAYDHSKALIIDPLVYGSYYGGDDGFDEVRAITSDNAGGTYLTGSTQASQFPSTYGPYLSLVGGTDAFLTKFQGDAYSHDFAAYLGGSLNEFGGFLQVDAFNNVWVAGRTESADFPGNTRDNIMFLTQTGGGVATGGTFMLTYRNVRSAPIAWNASTATVSAAINGIPALTGHVVSVTSSGGLLPGATYRIELDNSRPFPLGVISNRFVLAGVEISQGLPSLIIAAQASNPADNQQTLTRRGSVPDVINFPIAQFTLTFTSAASSQTTAAMPGNATAALINTNLLALSNIGTTNNIPNVSCSGGPVDVNQVLVNFQNTLNGAQQLLVVDNSFMIPVPVYGVTHFTDVFVMRFTPDANTVLAPAETLMFGGDFNESISGLAVVPNADPHPGDPVEFIFAGDVDATVNGDIPQAFPGGKPAYLNRYRYNAGVLTQVATSSFYVTGSGGAKVDVTGVAVDSVGSAYLAGTVRFQGNSDTSVGGSPVFQTTPLVFAGGRFLKNNDLFVRKYDETGVTMMYSCLVGGNNDDVAGGTNTDLSGARYETGSSIAVDAVGNAYITGVSHSFNYPRTRGVYGEVFSNGPLTVVTKLNQDASQIVYSTNLKNIGDCPPAGIGVDSRGFAFVTGNIHFGLQFPPNDPPTPSDPTAYAPGDPPTVQTTGDAIDPVNDSPAPGELPTVEPWLNVLNDTATTLVYGTYLGGNLDDVVYAPYVDRFGDVWASGWTDSFRFYFNVAGTPVITNGALPDAMITELAFKRFGDAAGLTGVGGILYGALTGSPFTLPQTIGVNYQRDGFLVKLRVGSAAIQGLSFNPTTVAGGLGATTTGTVTLTSAAPPGGADVQVDLTDTSAASFSPDPANPIGSQTITVPEGLTSVDFTLYTYPVATSTQVQAKATYTGSFKIAQITVVPWLQTLALTPTSVVGGNTSTGRVTLAQPAPTGGVTIDLITDSPALIVLPTTPTVTVPEGQTSAVFPIGSHGVVQPTNTLITASLLGAGRSQTLTLTQAKIVAVSFLPTTVAGGSAAAGTVLLDGEAGAGFDVQLSINAGTAGYTIVTPSGSGTTNVILSFVTGDRSQGFVVNTMYEASNTNRKVTATRQAQNGFLFSSVQGTLFISAIQLNSLTIAPNPVVGGNAATGTVQLSGPAPTGGAKVFLFSLNTNVATVPASVTVPSGQSSATFPVTTTTQPADTTVIIRANRGGSSPNIDRVLTVQAMRFTLTLNPTSVVGGLQNSTGKVTLIGAAPVGGLAINLNSNLPSAASVPASVTVPAGQTQATFQVTTANVTSTKSVTIKGYIGAINGPNTSSAVLTVKPLGVVSIVLTPATLRGTGTFNATVTLDSVIGNSPMNLTLNYGANGSVLIATPGNNILTIPANTNHGTKSAILTKKVSRILSTTISVTLNGKTVSALLTVKP